MDEMIRILWQRWAR